MAGAPLVLKPDLAFLAFLDEPDQVGRQENDDRGDAHAHGPGGRGSRRAWPVDYAVGFENVEEQASTAARTQRPGDRQRASALLPSNLLPVLPTAGQAAVAGA